MSLKDDYNFRKFLETQPNKYQLVLDVARDAREMADDYEDLILHSEAITHSLHGTRPKLKTICRWESEASEIRDMFCSIEDKDVCDAVYDSFYASRERHHIVFVYGSVKDAPRQSRIRILTRMLYRSIYGY
jgi:hypothetical protein